MSGEAPTQEVAPGSAAPPRRKRSLWDWLSLVSLLVTVLRLLKESAPREREKKDPVP